jgi:hypothetical protein
VKDVSLVAGSREPRLRQYGGEVDEGARDGCHRDPSPLRGISRFDRATAAVEHALNPGSSWAQDLRSGRRALEQAKEMGSRTAAEESSLAAGPDRCEVSRLPARRSMPDPVHAPMLAEQ